MEEGRRDRVDVVIVTALRLEYEQALLAAPDGGSAWRAQEMANGWPAARRTLRGAQGELHVLLALAPDMGMTSATALLVSLVERFAPQCIAMCGVCAGNPKHTGLGDVVAADRVYRHDTGKAKAAGLEQDLTTYNLRNDWKLALGAMRPAELFRGRAWFEARPLPSSWRVLRALAAFAEPSCRDRRLATDPTLQPREWTNLLAHLHASWLIENDRLTPRGAEHLRRELAPYEGALPDLSPSGPYAPLRLHVASMASGNQVIEDQAIWGKVTPSVRKTRALEMEAAALGEVASLRREPRLDFLVLKGVMDFADEGRDDHFKEYAARVSAECLLWFLRHQLRPQTTAQGRDAAHDRAGGVHAQGEMSRIQNHAQLTGGGTIISGNLAPVYLQQSGAREHHREQQERARDIVAFHREDPVGKPRLLRTDTALAAILAISFVAMLAISILASAL